MPQFNWSYKLDDLDDQLDDLKDLKLDSELSIANYFPVHHLLRHNLQETFINNRIQQIEFNSKNYDLNVCCNKRIEVKNIFQHAWQHKMDNLEKEHVYNFAEIINIQNRTKKFDENNITCKLCLVEIGFGDQPDSLKEAYQMLNEHLHEHIIVKDQFKCVHCSCLFLTCEQLKQHKIIKHDNIKCEPKEEEEESSSEFIINQLGENTSQSTLKCLLKNECSSNHLILPQNINLSLPSKIYNRISKSIQTNSNNLSSIIKIRDATLSKMVCLACNQKVENIQNHYSAQYLKCNDECKFKTRCFNALVEHKRLVCETPINRFQHIIFDRYVEPTGLEDMDPDKLIIPNYRRAKSYDPKYKIEPEINEIKENWPKQKCPFYINLCMIPQCHGKFFRDFKHAALHLFSGNCQRQKDAECELKFPLGEVMGQKIESIIYRRCLFRIIRSGPIEIELKQAKINFENLKQIYLKEKRKRKKLKNQLEQEQTSKLSKKPTKKQNENNKKKKSISNNKTQSKPLYLGDKSDSESGSEDDNDDEDSDDDKKTIHKKMEYREISPECISSDNNTSNSSSSSSSSQSSSNNNSADTSSDNSSSSSCSTSDSDVKNEDDDDEDEDDDSERSSDYQHKQDTIKKRRIQWIEETNCKKFKKNPNTTKH